MHSSHDDQTRYVDFIACSTVETVPRRHGKGSLREGRTLTEGGLRRRGLLLDAARRRLLSGDELTTSAVAVEAETSIGTVYRYFDDREDILVSLADAGRIAFLEATSSLSADRDIERMSAASIIVTALMEVYSRDEALARAVDAVKAPSAVLRGWIDDALEVGEQSAHDATTASSFRNLDLRTMHQCAAIVQASFAADGDAAQIRAIVYQLIAA